MSITREELAKCPKPEAQDKVLDNNPDRIGICKCWCLRRGENQSFQRKTSWSKEENQQQTQPTYGAESWNWTLATFVGGEYSHHCAIPAPSTLSLKTNRVEVLLNWPQAVIITVNPGHAWTIFLKFERIFEIYMSVLKIANEISEFPINFPSLLTV